MRHQIFMIAIGCFFFLSSFVNPFSDSSQPKTITRTTSLVNGKEIEKTIILLDGTTSREDLIKTCNFLAQENVQLTFDKLSIGKSFLGLVGRSRIRIAEGQIKLADGSLQEFKAGGPFSFKYIKIQYTNDVALNTSQIEMIEIIK